jgi:hypothetical protein
LPQIMASVRVQPQHRPAFRLRPLDVVFALAAAFALYGMFIGATALRAIFPFVVDTIDPEALFSGTTGMILLLTGGCAIVGLAISLPVAAAVHTMTSRERDPLAAQS